MKSLFSFVSRISFIIAISVTPALAAPSVVVIDKSILTLPDNVLADCIELADKLQVKVVPVDMEPSLRNDESVRVLSGATQSKGNQRTLGVTRSSYQIAMEYSLNSVSVKGTKGACSVPSITVYLNQANHEVSIGREFSPNTCLFNHIKHHEYVHVAINKKGLYDSTAILTRELQQQFKDKVFVGKPDTLANMLDESMRGYWTIRASQLHANVMKLHKVLDSPAEYAKNQSVCNGSLNSVLRANGY